MLKYLESSSQTDVFHLDEEKLSSTLRIDSGVSAAIVSTATSLSIVSREGCL